MSRLKFKIALIVMCIFSHANGQLFKLLPSESTNVHFENTITDEKDHNILIYSNYYGGAGVGVGDFNKDGWTDIYVTQELYDDQPDLRKNLLYINTGKTFDLGNGKTGVRFEEKNY